MYENRMEKSVVLSNSILKISTENFWIENFGFYGKTFTFIENSFKDRDTASFPNCNELFLNFRWFSNRC